MFVGEGGEGEEGFEGTGGVEPWRDVRGVDGAPTLDGDGDVGLPEQKNGDGGEELVARPIETLDEAAEARDANGGGDAVGFDGGLERGEPRGLERRGFDAV